MNAPDQSLLINCLNRITIITDTINIYSEYLSSLNIVPPEYINILNGYTLELSEERRNFSRLQLMSNVE